MHNFECILSSFEEIYPIWYDKLCPGRISKIEPMSSLCWRLPSKIVKDGSIFESYSPTFWVVKDNWAVKDNEKIIGVNSGFRTDEKVYRSRGLYVDSAYRRQGISQILFRQAILQGKKEELEILAKELLEKEILYQSDLEISQSITYHIF